jgi:putative tRNA adenosine deaminase-associated protein
VGYFAAAMARRSSGWDGAELDLDDVIDVDDLADLARDAVGGEGAEPLLIFLEENDEWLGIARVDGGGDARLFLSDGRTVGTSDLARALFVDAGPAPEDEQPSNDADEDERLALAAGDPVGDPDVLADLGTSAQNLLALCVEEGMLPGDVIAALCENAGCLDEFERLRES